MHVLIAASFGHHLEQIVYQGAKALFYPVLILTLVCLVWALIELGYFFFEAWHRWRYRDLEKLEVGALKARDAFERGQPRRAYRYLQENAYSVVVARFLFDLIRNYQTTRLPEKPLKLLQEYELYTMRRLERTRILVRIGPMLGLMGTLIPLAPALQALADGNTRTLADDLTVAFSITVLGLLIGGLGFVMSIIRDRFYAQDISDLEYLLELIEGRSEALRVGKPRRRKGDVDDYDSDLGEGDEEETMVVLTPAEGAAAAADAAAAESGSAPAAEAAPGAALDQTGAAQPFARPMPIVPGFADPAAPVVPAPDEVAIADAAPGPVPDVAAPDVAAPDVPAPDVAAAEAVAESYAVPEPAQPEPAVTPDATTPESPEPAFTTPDDAAPEAPTPLTDGFAAPPPFAPPAPLPFDDAGDPAPR